METLQQQKINYKMKKTVTQTMKWQKKAAEEMESMAARI